MAVHKKGERTCHWHLRRRGEIWARRQTALARMVLVQLAEIQAQSLAQYARATRSGSREFQASLL
jgi:hypothetical protein